ncbi:MAG TPA: hypothetical protein VFE58_09065 [Tepidisphaeraceae bacterium]|jgi:hypothetical protein|nr:hypothetical protein [Tepidisphaeraceae bacterium]
MRKISFFKIPADDVIAGVHHIVFRCGGNFWLMPVRERRGSIWIEFFGRLKMVPSTGEACISSVVVIEVPASDEIEVATIEEGV